MLSDEIAADSAKLDPHLHGWINYWYGHFRRSNANGDDPNTAGESDLEFAFPMLSVFDRLPAVPNTFATASNNANSSDGNRVELYNRGARILNASDCIASGQLLILATAKGPLPIPLQVDDNKMSGNGVVYYQVVMPMGRTMQR